jgi:hypothetical protein
MGIKKFTLHWDAAAAIALVFVASFGFNLYQRHQYQSLLQELVDTKWDAENMKVNWQYVKSKLEQCEGPAAAPSAPGD